MFERYTEVARRTVFFARYEASVFVSPYIETEHLLLGLLREDHSFRNRLPAGAAEQIRKRIEERVPQPERRTATSVDLPRSQDSRRALACAAGGERGAAAPSHRLLPSASGILRIETSTAAVLLQEFGIDYAGYREVAAGLQASLPLPASARAGPFGTAAAALQRLLGAAMQLEAHGGQRLKRAGWTRKEALG